MLLWSVTLQSVPCGCGGNTNPDPGKYVNRKYVNTRPYALWIIIPAYLSLISAWMSGDFFKSPSSAPTLQQIPEKGLKYKVRLKRINSYELFFVIYKDLAVRIHWSAAPLYKPQNRKMGKKARFTVRKLGNIICDTLLQHRHPTMVN